jgi:REP element-mobilizing transposase RayT
VLRSRRSRVVGRERISTATVRERWNRMASPSGSFPLAYLISFRCYGTWLHGDLRGSVDRQHRGYRTALVEPSETRRSQAFRRLNHAPVALDERQRLIVDETIRGVCRNRAWKLRALNVRSNHVHAVVAGEVIPEQIMNAFKSWSTRRMIETDAWPSGTKAWSRHGSTRYLWTPEAVDMACRYVTEGQGKSFPFQGR